MSAASTLQTRTAADVVAATVRPEIQALTAYVVAKADGMIKLDAMENPFALPEDVRARIAAAVAAVPVNRYPDGGAAEVRAALRRAAGIPGHLGVLLGNGSDELIQVITSALARPGAVVLAPEPSFVMYRMNALYAGMHYVGVPLREDFALDVDAMLVAIERHRPALIHLAYPNNPTGNLFAAKDMLRVIAATPGLVVVDEAYHAFAEASFLPYVGELPNLLLLRTTTGSVISFKNLPRASVIRGGTGALRKACSNLSGSSFAKRVSKFGTPKRKSWNKLMPKYIDSGTLVSIS